MAILPISIARVSDQLRSSVALSTIAKTQADLLTLQNQISTGKRVNVPSDDPAAATVIQQLQKTLSQRAAYATNLQYATSQLGQVDSSLGDLTDVLQQAQTIASQTVGTDTTATQRQAAAAVVDTLISRAEAVGNTQLNGVYVFGGDRSTAAPFVNANGAIKYVGSPTVLQNNFDENALTPFTVDGEKVFGALTSEVAGTVDLSAGLGAGASLTLLTKLSQLNGGAGIDPAGITLHNGATATSLSFNGDTTVEDLLNTINGSNAGVLARINAAGTGIDIVNPTQGSTLTISENGGTTAAQLGVRNFTPQTLLSSLNGGKGVSTAAGPDFQIARADGSTFAVDVDGLHTVQDVIDAINTASGGTGVTASFAQNTNGITLTDSTGGGGAPTVTAINGSNAARDLGLLNPASGNTIIGGDVNPVVSTGIFASLQSLRAALNTNDQSGITRAAEALQTDHDRVVLVRGETGAQTQALQARQTHLDTENLAAKSLLSNFQDTDVTAAISKYQLLQTQLQASYKLTGLNSNLSLLDFLR